MASVSGGYDNKFLDTPPDDYTCLICHSVCRDPQQLKCCAKLYCQTCLEDYRKTKHTCPTCRKRMVTFEDKLSHRRIKALKVSCDNESAGCTWAGELGSLEEHTTKCDFDEVSCTNNCSSKVLRRDLEKHVVDECPKRKHKCPHCDLEGEYSNITTTHLEQCPNVTTTCPNEGCNVQAKGYEMDDHRTSCPKEVVKCSYAEVGCKKAMKREKLSNHKSEQVERHLQLAVQEVATLRDKVNAMVVPVVFKMPKFSKLRDTNGGWYSPKYYSHPGGYRMKFRVDVNGDGEENRSHISVYMYLVGSDHDDDLVWPFRGAVTMQVLNQLEDAAHASDVIDFTCTDGDDEDDIGRRPQGDTNQHGWGFPRLLSHDKLKYNAVFKRQYLMNDCLYFRVSKVRIELSNKPWLTVTS